MLDFSASQAAMGLLKTLSIHAYPEMGIDTELQSKEKKKRKCQGSINYEIIIKALILFNFEDRRKLKDSRKCNA